MQDLGNTEVQQLWRAITGHQNIRGLDVSVNNSVTMRISDRGAHLPKEFQSLVEW